MPAILSRFLSLSVFLCACDVSLAQEAYRLPESAGAPVSAFGRIGVSANERVSPESVRGGPAAADVSAFHPTSSSDVTVELSPPSASAFQPDSLTSSPEARRLT